jgi:hypothetical protein
MSGMPLGSLALTIAFSNEMGTGSRFKKMRTLK